MKITFKQNFTFLSAFFIGSMIIFSQGFSLPTDYIRNSVQGNNVKFEQAKGSPFVPAEFVQGEVHINKDTYNSLLRYNAYNDEIELKENDGQVISLLKRPYIKASFDKFTYAIYPYSVGKDKVKQGYFVELTNTEESAVLLMKHKKVYLPAREAESSYKTGSPASFEDELSYYVKQGDQPAKPIKLGKKNVLSYFDNKSELKSYVSKNKLKLKSQDQLVQFINYYNTL